MYVFYLDDLLLPEAPERVETKISNRNETINLINEGEINLLKRPGLTEISFTACIPGVKYPWTGYHYTDFWHPVNFLDRFETFKATGKPFDFVIARKWDDGSGLSFRTDMKVTLERYTIEEDAENGKDIMVDILLKQWQPFGTKSITIEKATPTEPAKAVVKDETPRDPPAPKDTNYTVTDDDTLWGIAKRFLGDAERWPEIYNANKDVIEKAAREHGRESSSQGHWIYGGRPSRCP